MASPFAHLYAAGTSPRTPNAQRKLSPVGAALLKQTGPNSDPRIQDSEDKAAGISASTESVITPKRQTHFKLPDGSLKPIVAPSGERYLLKNSGWSHPRDPKTNEPVLINEQGEARSIYEDAPRIKKDGKIYAAPAGYEKKEIGIDPDFNPNALTPEQEKANAAKQKEDEKTAKEQDAYAKAVLERDVSQIITDSEVKSLETSAAEKKAKLAEAEITDKRALAKEILSKAEKDADDRKIGSAEALTKAQEEYNAARKSEEQAKAATRAIEARQIEEDLANAKQKEMLNQFESALKLENTGRRQSLAMPTPAKTKEPTARETAPTTTPVSALPTGKGIEKAIATSKAPDIKIETPIPPTFLTGAPRTDIPPVPTVPGGPLPWQKSATRTLVIGADPNFGDEPIEPGTDLTQEVEFDAQGKGTLTGDRPSKARGKKMAEGFDADVPPEWTSSNALTAQATARDTGTDVIHTDSTLSVELPASRLDAEGALKVEGKQVGVVRRTMLGLPEVELAPSAFGQTASPSYRSSDPFKGAPEYAAPSAGFREQQKKAGNPFNADKPWREQRWGDKQVADFIENWKSFGDADRRKLMDSELLKDMEGEMPDARWLYTNGYVSLQQARQIDQAVYGRSQKLPDHMDSYKAWLNGDTPAAAKLREMEKAGTFEASDRELLLARQRVLTEWEGEYRRRHGRQPDFDANALVAARKAIAGNQSTGLQTFVSSTEDLGSSVFGSLAGVLEMGLKDPVGFKASQVEGKPLIAQDKRDAVAKKKAEGKELTSEEKRIDYMVEFAGGRDLTMEEASGIRTPEQMELTVKKLVSDVKTLGSKWKEKDEDPRNVLVIAPGLAVEAGVKSFDTQEQKDKAVAEYLAKRESGEGNALADIDLLKEKIDDSTLTPEGLKEIASRIKSKALTNTGIYKTAAKLNPHLTQAELERDGKADRYDLTKNSAAASLLAAYQETRDESYIELLKDLVYSTADREDIVMKAARFASMNGYIQPSDSLGAFNLTRRGIQIDLKEALIEAGGDLLGVGISKLLNPATRMFKAAGKAGTAATKVQKAMVRADNVLGMIQNSKAMQSMRSMADSYSKAGLKANTPMLNAVVQKIKEVPLQSAGEYAQGFTAAMFEEGRDMGEINKQAMLEAAGGGMMAMINIAPVAALSAAERMKANAAEQQASKRWADDWNKRNPEQPITAADAMGINNIIDHRDRNEAVARLRSAIDVIAAQEGSPTIEQEQALTQAIFDIQQIEQVGIQTYQELEGIGDKRMKAFVKAGLRTLTGQPLTTEDQKALGAVNAAGEPLIIMVNGKVVFTKAGLAEVAQAAQFISGNYFPHDQESQELWANNETQNEDNKSGERGDSISPAPRTDGQAQDSEDSALRELAGGPLRTPKEWQRLTGHIILDADGWDRWAKDGPDSFSTPISYQDFSRRASRSTTIGKPLPAQWNESPAASPAEAQDATSDQLTSEDGGTSVVDEIDTELNRKHAEWQAGKKEVDDAFNATEPHSKERKEAREKRKQWEEKNGQVPPPSSSNPLSDIGALSNKDSDTKFSLAGTGWRLTGEKEKSIRGKTILRVTNGKEWGWVEESDLTDQHRQILARSSGTSVDKAAHDAASSPTNNKRPPTPDEIAAGNYAKGHPTIGGIKISIENPQGSVRKGKDEDGKAWEVKMSAHYGYMRNTVGADGDHIDVFVKPGTPEDFDGMAFVIPQRKPDGSFDEHKVMIGYGSIEEAKKAYKAHYAKGWKGYRPAMPVPMSELAQMVKSGKLKKPNQRQRTNEQPTSAGTTPSNTDGGGVPTPTPGVDSANAPASPSDGNGNSQRASETSDGRTPQKGGLRDSLGQSGGEQSPAATKGQWSIRTTKGRKLTIPASAAADSEQAKKALAAQLGGQRGELLVLDSLQAPDVEQTLTQAIYTEVAKVAARTPARDKQFVMHLGRLILAAVRKHEKMLGIAFADIKIVSGKVEGGGMYVQGKTLHISPATLIRSMMLFKPAYIETFVDTGFFHEALHPIIEMNVTAKEAAMFWDELKPEAQEAFLTSYEQDNPGSLVSTSTQKGYEYLRALIERKYNAHTSEELFIHAGVSAKIIAAIKKVVEFLRDLQSSLKEGGDYNLVKDIADKAEMAFLDSGVATGNVDAQRNIAAGKAKAEPIGNSARARSMVTEEFGAMAKALNIDIVPNYAGASARYVISDDGKKRGGYIEINPVKIAAWSPGQMKEAMREEMIHAIEDRALIAEMQKAGYKLSDPYIQSGDYHVDFFKGVYEMMSPEQIEYVKAIYSSHGNREYVIGSEFRRMLLQNEHYKGLTESAFAGGKNSAKAKKAIAAIASLLKIAVKYLRALATTNTPAGKQAARIYEESRKMLQKLDPRGEVKPLAMAAPSLPESAAEFADISKPFVPPISDGLGSWSPKSLVFFQETSDRKNVMAHVDQDTFISFRPRLKSDTNPSIPLNGETAIKTGDGKYHILNGDHRSAYKEAYAKGGKAGVMAYYRLSSQKSPWSNDNKLGNKKVIKSLLDEGYSANDITQSMAAPQQPNGKAVGWNNGIPIKPQVSNQMPVKDVRKMPSAPKQRMAGPSSDPMRESVTKGDKLTGDGRSFAKFFASVTQGAEDKFKPKGNYQPAITLDPASKAFQVTRYRFRGNFDDHIATSIPGFDEVQAVVGSAIVKTFGDKGADMLDIGASEGALNKAISGLTKGNIKTLAIDPNTSMAQTFKAKGSVKGADFNLSAFGSKEEEGKIAWTEDDGTEVKFFDPKGRKFDVVHEAMVFQFISNARNAQVKRVKELMKPEGIAIFEQKFGDRKEVFDANEDKKDRDWKSRHYTMEQLEQKRQAVLNSGGDQVEGMTALQVAHWEMEEVLKSNFKHVVQFWSSGNFRGYVGSDSANTMSEFLANLQSTDSEFATQETPRVVAGEMIMPYAKEALSEFSKLSLEEEGGDTLNLDGSKYTGGGVAIPVLSKNVDDYRNMNTDDIGKFINLENIEYVAAGGSVLKAGIYKFPNSTKASIDLNIIAPREKRDEGVKIAGELGQESAFDLDTFENIKTGQDGMNPRKPTVEEVRDIARRLSMSSPQAAPKPGQKVAAYHGTPYSFDKPRRSSTGFWLTTDREQAEKGYARGGEVKQFTVDTTGFADLTRDKNLAKKLIADYNKEPDVANEGREIDIDPEYAATIFSGETAESTLSSMGYTGAIVWEEPGMASINAFDPDKSVQSMAAPQIPDIDVAIKLNGKIYTGNDTHYYTTIDYIVKQMPAWQREDMDQAYQAASEILTNDWLKERGYEEGFMVNGEWMTRTQTLSYVRALNLPTPLADAEGREWFDSEDIHELAPRQRMAAPSLAPHKLVGDALTVSVRQPSGKKSALSTEPLNIRMTEVWGTPYEATLADTVRNYPQLTAKESRRSDKAILESFIESAQKNLRWLMDQIGKDNWQRARLWYAGANRISLDMAKEFGITPAQSAAVLAVLSPQKDWFQNVDLGRRVLNGHIRNSSDTLSAEHIDHALSRMRATNEFAKLSPEKQLAKTKEKEDLRSEVGKQYAELSPTAKALMIRSMDEMTNTPSYPTISPEGDFGGNATLETSDAERKIAWQSYAVIEKAIRVLEDGSPEMISSTLGNAHKVRNFFNNISAPFDANGYVTIDTHAISAALLEAIGGSHPQVAAALGGSSNKDLGLKGSYVIYAEAYSRLAEEMGLLPREIQSITWEAVRLLFDRDDKRVIASSISGLWKDYRHGRITHNDLLTKIHDTSGGFRSPSWAAIPARTASDQGKLLIGSDGPRPADVPAGRGTGGADTERPAGRATDLNRGDVVAPQRMAGPNSDPQRANFVEPGFYSELQRTIASKMPNSMKAIPASVIPGRKTSERTITNPKTGQVIKVIKATNEPDRKVEAKGIGEQMKAMLLNADVTPDELKWSGLISWLDGRESVTKAEVEQYLRDEGQVRFVEYHNGLKPRTPAQINEDSYNAMRERLGRTNKLTPDAEKVLTDWLNAAASNYDVEDVTGLDPEDYTSSAPEGQVRFGQSDLQLPGGSKYREVVLAMPVEIKVYDTKDGSVVRGGFSKWSEAQDWIRANNRHPNLRNLNIEADNRYTSSHFSDVPNYVAHMRLNERTDAAGKSGLFIEELQSDRHQTGRKEGYITKMSPETHEVREVKTSSRSIRPDGWGVFAKGSETTSGVYITESDAIAAIKRGDTLDVGVPDAPFRQSSAWGLHLFKRALRDAVESGKEWIGWTVGDTQNERYGLEKHFSEIILQKPFSDDRIYIDGRDKDGRRIVDKIIQPNELADHVGEELAAKFEAMPWTPYSFENSSGSLITKDSKRLKGLDLKTGGEGMRGFYDKIMPREIGDYVKQWGAKVEKSELGGVGYIKMVDGGWRAIMPAGQVSHTFDDAESAQKYADNSGIPKTLIWKIEITPQMRQSIANEGQALFMAGPRSESPEAANEALEAWLALPATAAELQMLREQALSEETGKRTVGDPSRAGLLGSGDKENRERDVIIQFRKNHKAPEKVVDWMRDGQELADSDPDMVADALLDNFYDGVGYDTPEQVFASAIVVSRMFKEARQKGDPALLRKAQALAYADGAARTENARILRSMVDPHRTPEERMNEFFSKLISTPSEFQRIEIEKAPSPLAKEREIAELKAKIEELQKQVGTQTQGPVVEQKKKLEKTLDQVKQRKDRKTLVDEYTEARRKAVAAALKKEGLSEEDIFVSANERLGAQNSDPVQEAIAQHPEEHREAINYIMRGYSHKDIAQMTKLPVNVVAAIHQEFRQKSMRSSLAKWVKKGNTLFDTIQNGLKKVFGMSMAAPIPLAQARAQIIAEQEIERQLNVLVPTAQQVNSGKMVAVIVNGKNGQDVTIKVPFSASDFRSAYRVGRAISTSESNAFDKIYEYWISFGLLSGPETHWANVMGNAGMLAVHLLAQRPLEAAINFMVRDPKSATFGEYGEMVKGILPGIRDAFALAALAWDAEADPIGARYMDETIDLKFDTTGNLSKVGTMKGPAIQGVKGRVFRVSTRFLLAMDAFFKSITANIEVGARAQRLGKMAQANGTLGTAKGDLEAFIAQQVATPGSESWELAIETSKELAFQGDNWLTLVAGSLTARNQDMLVSRLSNDIVKASATGDQSKVFNAKFSRYAMMMTGFVMKFIFPFVKTPTNIIRIGARKAGLGAIGLIALAPYVLSKGVYNIAKGKNFHDNNQSALMVTWLAEQVQAAAMWMYLWSISEGDDDDKEKPFYIVGSRPYGTSKPGEREEAYAKSGGTQVVMVRNDDGTYTPWAYGRYEPFATVLTSVVDTMREIKDANRLGRMGLPGGSWNNIMTNSIASFASQLQDKSFFQGFANVTKAFEKVMNKKSGELATDTIKGFLQGFVPNIVRQPLRNSDPIVRDSKKADAAYLALPMGRFAEPLLDFYGRESEKQGTSASRLLIRAASKPQDTTKAEEMIERWNLLHPDKKYQPSRISKADMWIYGPNKERRIITDNKLKTEFERELGQEILRRHNELASGIEDFPDDFDDRLRNEATKAREQVRKDFLNKSFERQKKLLK